MNAYKTLATSGEAEFTQQKSRFIGRAAPAADEAAALAFLAGIRVRCRDASHHCYAYIIGQNAGITRYSDDGEPSGTAGAPILGVLQAQGVVNAAVVVTRYFGGVLLGAGGLSRAYARGSAAAVAAAGVALMQPCRRYLADIPYPLWDRAAHALGSFPCVQEGQNFTDRVTVTLLVRSQDAPGLLALLARVTGGRAEAELVEEAYAAWA
ncbi:MAG: YigZ family protein [Oscillospiraceae bacterium]|jgi:uncharacterized YigZ family protein|nr:YigZ family protein [Oscillospiraceae bacterium]